MPKYTSKNLKAVKNVSFIPFKNHTTKNHRHTTHTGQTSSPHTYCGLFNPRLLPRTPFNPSEQGHSKSTSTWCLWSLFVYSYTNRNALYSLCSYLIGSAFNQIGYEPRSLCFLSQVECKMVKNGVDGVWGMGCVCLKGGGVGNAMGVGRNGIAGGIWPSYRLRVLPHWIIHWRGHLRKEEIFEKKYN